MTGWKFKGRFTPEVRARLRAKRLELGASFQTLGNTLGVNGSTLRKWEVGEILDCHGKNMMLVGRYLDGQFDQAVAEASAAQSNPPPRPGLPPELRRILERVAELYELCRHYPGLGEKVVAAFSATYCQMVGELHRVSAGQPL